MKYLVAFMVMIIMPVYHWYLPPFIILWVILSIIGFLNGNIEINKINPKHRILFLLFILLFIWQLIGMIYSDNPKEGWRNLELHLSLIVFSIVMFSPGKIIIEKINLLLKAFALSTFAFIVFCYAFALFRSLNIQDGTIVFHPFLPRYTWLNYFYGSEFAVFQHTSYLSMFTLLSVFIALEAFFDNSLQLVRRNTWLFLGFVLFVSIYFLSSRAGILIAITTLPFYLFLKFRAKGKSRYFGFGLIIILLVLVPIALTNPRVNNYLEWRSERNIEHFAIQNDRYIIWNSAKEILKKNFLLGVGTGDIQDELNKEYLRTGNKKLADVNTNAHNQYFEIIAENGIAGLLIFLAIMGTMIWLAVRQKNLIYLMFIIIVFSSFMFETILNRLAGVTFFSLFGFLLIFLKKTEKS